jgi:hypothetical protein
MERGNQIHKLAEDYTKGKLDKLPKELELFKDQFEILKTSNPHVEVTWAFTKDWHETMWNDWQNCMLRIKVDASCLDDTVLYVIDHKTGKERDGYEAQLSLYALGGMLKYPHIKEVNTQLWYLDSGNPIEQTYKIKEQKTLLKDWNKKTTPMLNDTQFAPKPGNHCRWCTFSKAKGGPCKF